MPKQKTITVYQYHELSDSAKERARDWYIGAGLDWDWYDFIFEDAKTIGLKLTGFDLDRNRHATGDFISNPEAVAAAIKENHGAPCETYKTACDYLETISALDKEYERRDEDGFEADWENWDEKKKEADAEFLRSLLEDYSIMLQKEYEHLYSEEYIAEVMEANEYEFNEQGKRV